MSFNPDPTKPADEILFSQKTSEINHPPLYFNGIEVKRVSEHKHLGLVLDPKLNFAAHIKEKSATAKKGIGKTRKSSGPGCPSCERSLERLKPGQIE